MMYAIIMFLTIYFLAAYLAALTVTFECFARLSTPISAAIQNSAAAIIWIAFFLFELRVQRSNTFLRTTGTTAQFYLYSVSFVWLATHFTVESYSKPFNPRRSGTNTGSIFTSTLARTKATRCIMTGFEWFIAPFTDALFKMSYWTRWTVMGATFARAADSSWVSCCNFDATLRAYSKGHSTPFLVQHSYDNGQVGECDPLFKSYSSPYNSSIIANYQVFEHAHA